jgi:ribosome-associated heat shock protein Hsp15
LAAPVEKQNFNTAPPAPQKLRLDKWLFAARFFKSRERAIALIDEGHLRLNGVVCAKPAQGVGAGDVLTFVQAGRVRVIRVAAMPLRRGPASAAQSLYVDLDAGPANPPDLP